VVDPQASLALAEQAASLTMPTWSSCSGGTPVSISPLFVPRLRHLIAMACSNP